MCKSYYINDLNTFWALEVKLQGHWDSYKQLFEPILTGQYQLF